MKPTGLAGPHGTLEFRAVHSVSSERSDTGVYKQVRVPPRWRGGTKLPHAHWLRQLRWIPVKEICSRGK
jgi:hypothetical protein